MTQENAPFKGFRRWFAAGFGPETLPIIPPDATIAQGSTVRQEHRGKTPGVLNSDGTWNGLTGRWPDKLVATAADARKWVEWGASVGLQSRTFLGLDVDVEDAAVAAEVENLAMDWFGLGPVRFRAGSPRRLIVFKRAAGHPAIRKTRLQWADATDRKHAVELLAHGQQFVVEGPHNAGGHYEWRHNESPCEWGPDELTEITAEQIDGFFGALCAAVEGRGWGDVGKSVGASAQAMMGTRKGLDDPSLWASSPALVLEALAAWPNDGTSLPTHDDFVGALAAIKGALGPSREDHYGEVEQWALGFDANTSDYVQKTWGSITDAALGAEWLFQHAKAGGNFSGDAQEEFDEAGNDLIGETPLERMTKRYVWVQQLERYIDLKDGEVITAKSFNSANIGVAEFGRTGVQSAEATFQNSVSARKAKIATYRPGRGPLIDEANAAGVNVPAVNLWRPSSYVPLPNITDLEVKPWLDLVTLLFGEPGDAAREHFLDWAGHAIQHPGRKINHALVILGNQGVGKDSVFWPLWRAIGDHNVQEIKPENITSDFTEFLKSQVVVVQEMMNFSRKEVYNRLKDWIAAPPAHVKINEKFIKPFSIPNIQLWVFMTNHDDAIALDEDDRRFWVHSCLIDTRREPAYFDALYNWYKQKHGVAKVAGFLKSRNISRFNPNAAPPSTQAKREMIDLALPASIRWLGEQFGEDGAFTGRELLTTKELLTHARTAFDAPPKVSETIRERHVTAALRRAGYKRIERRIRIGNFNGYLWTDKAPGIMMQMDLEQLKARHEADATKSEAQRKGA